MTFDEIVNSRNILSNGAGAGLKRFGAGMALPKNTEDTDEEFIVKNTFQTDEDGTNYGEGRDGRTYSYNLNNRNKVINLVPLEINEQKNIIKKISNGKINIDDSITNPVTLTYLQRSVNRMFNYGDKKLTPRSVNIMDERPGSAKLSGIKGVAEDYITPYLGEEDVITLDGTDFPDINYDSSRYNGSIGWSANRSGNYGDSVPTHELAHTAQYEADEYLRREFNRIADEAKEKKNKYPIDVLFLRWIDELYNGGESTIGEDRSVGATMMKEASRRYDAIAWSPEFGYEMTPKKIFERAAKKAGFDNVEDAVASISGYALSGLKQYGSRYDYAEPFAEAYTDVLLNGDNAGKFSKELITMYDNLIAARKKAMGEKEPNEDFEALRRMFTILPEGKNNFAAQVQRTKRFLTGGK